MLLHAYSFAEAISWMRRRGLRLQRRRLRRRLTARPRRLADCSARLSGCAAPLRLPRRARTRRRARLQAHRPRSRLPRATCRCA